ncbi:three component ABC system middle component [Bradyrhizobium sp.]|uniref:three component ABC system middle component n=1 Tax=Bradyrhizobium sp. TaxID=376 RepID=UPI001EB9BADB|nr:three component ABC system middle component [Bradyrhizobium sp.]MBV8921791.1 hypothetical protein [Bradyrhizobium sp.]MBV9980009.1 hypothetical protein [Bradyrhizobium sp.]
MTDEPTHERGGRTWASRPAEQANLFNPAFMAALSCRMVQDYTKKARQPMPFALVFLLPAVVLHRRSRENLPKSTATALLPWLQTNKEQLVTFAERVRMMKPMMQQGLMFALAQEHLAVEAGALTIGRTGFPAALPKSLRLTDESRECLERAAFLGRWFAAAGTAATIMAAWGVTP